MLTLPLLHLLAVLYCMSTCICRWSPQTYAWLTSPAVIVLLPNLLGLKSTDIDILVTSSSIFCPTPSLASMLINQFHMREDVQAYSLGGMGCGNGVIGIQLVRDMLQVSGTAFRWLHKQDKYTLSKAVEAPSIQQQLQNSHSISSSVTRVCWAGRHKPGSNLSGCYVSTALM